MINNRPWHNIQVPFESMNDYIVFLGAKPYETAISDLIELFVNDQQHENDIYLLKHIWFITERQVLFSEVVVYVYSQGDPMQPLPMMHWTSPYMDMFKLV